MNSICEKSLYYRCSCKTNYHLPLILPLYDGHCHIDLFFKYGFNETDLYNQLSNGRQIIFVDNRHHYNRWFINYELKSPNTKIYTTYGIHPKYIPSNPQYIFEQLENIFKHQYNLSTKTVGIGECGLDDTSSYSYDLQLRIFRFQLVLAAKYQLPLVLHGRGNHSFGLMLQELEQHLNPMHKIHWHCVNAKSDLKIISNFLKHFHNSFIGLNGSLISQNDLESQKIFHKWLLVQENILSKTIIETDYPFLKPYALQETQHNPITSIAYTAQQIVNILRKKNINTTKVIDQSNNNIRQMYDID
ncbi:unnamed protein product [Rotaria sp. Silwood2]|nr:unnamed protein product [Rotaria sp. Silwood2]CAF4615256.1 unnamed protein product [Rotaria sp. Silwood2]